VQGKPMRDRDFGDAIESDDEQRDQKVIFAHFENGMKSF
jgi:hypothetical protein